MARNPRRKDAVSLWKCEKTPALRCSIFGTDVCFCQLCTDRNCEEIFGLDDILFTPNVLYRNNGFMVAYLANLQYLHIEKPQGYSTDAAQKIAEETSVSSGGEENHTDKTDMEDQPNILVIMNEAFSDLSVYGDFNTTEDYMPFWRSLKKNTVAAISMFR